MAATGTGIAPIFTPEINTAFTELNSLVGVVTRRDDEVGAKLADVVGRLRAGFEEQVLLMFENFAIYDKQQQQRLLQRETHQAIELARSHREDPDGSDLRVASPLSGTRAEQVCAPWPTGHRRLEEWPWEPLQTRVGGKRTKGLAGPVLASGRVYQDCLKCQTVGGASKQQHHIKRCCIPPPPFCASTGLFKHGGHV